MYSLKLNFTHTTFHLVFKLKILQAFIWVLKKYNFLNKIRTVEKDLRQLVRHLYHHLTSALTQINKIMLENEMQNIYSELLE